MAQWHTLESARDEWPDAPVDYEDGGDDILSTLLAVAKEAVVAFAPTITSTAPAPVTVTDAVTSVALSGAGDVITAVVTVGEAAFPVAATLVIPEEYRPVDYPSVTADTAFAVFDPGDNAVLEVEADVPGGQTLRMFWTPADTSAWAESIPDGYRQAQLMQARNVWNSSKASPTGDFDGTSYGITSYPLDWQVRQLLRPKRGVPVLG